MNRTHETERQRKATREVNEISFHMGGAPSVLRVGDQFKNQFHSRLTVERIQLDDTLLEGNRVYFRGNPNPTSAGAILDHVYEGRWKRITGVIAGAALARDLIAIQDQESPTMSTPEEQEHAELEPTHAPTCECDECMPDDEPVIERCKHGYLKCFQCAQEDDNPFGGYAEQAGDLIGERAPDADETCHHGIAVYEYCARCRQHGHLSEPAVMLTGNLADTLFVKDEAELREAFGLPARKEHTMGEWLPMMAKRAGLITGLALALILPGHASARESVPTPAYLNPPANCTLGYDSDGPVTGWHLLAWAHTSAR